MKLNCVGWLPLLILLICKSFTINAQSVIVNEYFNAADVRDEWVELIVVGDNVDMRLWTIRDNNSTQTTWQTAVTFANVPFWNNLRRGTIIILRCRSLNSSAVNYAIDSNKNDGFIDVNIQNTALFSGGTFGTSPTFTGTTMRVDATGDILQLRNVTATHIHAFGHRSTVGTNWTALPTPKLNHAASSSSGNGVYVCPGRNLGNFDGSSGTTLTAAGTGFTLGLPNSCTGFTTENKKFIDSLRRPIFTTQMVALDSAKPGKIEFSWTAMANAVSADTSMGYIVLRYNKDSFTAPAAGTTYARGQLLGKSLIVGKFNSVDSIKMRDTNNIVQGGSYFYRVYGYRYSPDNVNGNNFNTSRGTAYDTTNFVSAQILNVLPLIVPINYVKGIVCLDKYYQIQLHNLSYIPTKVILEGTSKQYYKVKVGADRTVNIELRKSETLIANRLITINLQNAIGQTEQIAVAIPNTLCNDAQTLLSIAPNPSNGSFQIFGLDQETTANLQIFDLNGILVAERNFVANGGAVNLNGLNNGPYLVKAVYANKVQYLKVNLER